MGGIQCQTVLSSCIVRCRACDDSMILLLLCVTGAWAFLLMHYEANFDFRSLGKFER